MILVRVATLSDLTAYRSLQEAEWGGAMAATVEQLRSRIEHFPQGVLVAETDAGIAGFTSFIRIESYDYSHGPSWNEITSFGRCDSHVPSGPIVFGVDLTVSRRSPKGTMDCLLVGVGEYAIREGLKFILLGGRMPAYHRHKDRYTPEEYIRAKSPRGTRYLDPEIEIYSRVPGVKVVQPLYDYFDDPESLNYGVLLRWRNPFYGLPGRNTWARTFASLYRLEQSIDQRRRRRSKPPVEGDVRRPQESHEDDPDNDAGVRIPSP